MTDRDTSSMTETFVPLHSHLLSEQTAVRHGITRRALGNGPGEGNVGYGPPRNRDNAWRSRQGWAHAMGVDAEKIVTCSQVHGTTVFKVDAMHAGAGARPNSTSPGHADALITDVPGLVLVTLHADCAPILLVDPAGPVISAVHAGWRGTVGDIAGRVVQEMRHRFGSEPGRIRAFIGPAIGPCCYDVGPEVVAAWRAQTGVEPAAALCGEHHFDIAGANALLLHRAGLVDAHIDRSTVCTRCHGHEWFSHRGQGPLTGRFGAMIAITPPLAGNGT